MLERDIEKYLVSECKDKDILCYKFVSPQRRGVPDRILIRKGIVVFLELKAPGKSPSPTQVREHIKLTKAGATIIVIDDMDGVDWIVGSLTV